MERNDRNDAPDLPDLLKISAPQPLVRSVEQQGIRIIEDAYRKRSKRSFRTLVVDFGLASFCLVHFLWCARTVGLLP